MSEADVRVTIRADVGEIDLDPDVGDCWKCDVRPAETDIGLCLRCHHVETRRDAAK